MQCTIKTKAFKHFTVSASNGIKNNLKYILLDKELQLSIYKNSITSIKNIRGEK